MRWSWWGAVVVALVGFSMRAIRRSIGGEPCAAMAMTERVAEGDLSRIDERRYPGSSPYSFLDSYRCSSTHGTTSIIPRV
ncbi:hypothetical protein BTW10_07950 [Chromohalobacter japonicus]|uniref:Uncharacterized protein n=1 Tax=Chromohalobacter japonicus TaxID=223900 RepID=A0A1Q8TDK8_9GAMM|nr:MULTISPECIES: hypothetical protein [Chromohalobacter]MCT8470424.1 hypothetical protein [Chromohalobacter canadensis]OLO11769.1 hypothetical protein BTW10_07950 [Chromohalobacter japonicus]